MPYDLGKMFTTKHYMHIRCIVLYSRVVKLKYNMQAVCGADKLSHLYACDSLMAHVSSDYHI